MEDCDMAKQNYCVIMAGGIGSRFWPLSKDNYPKQFLDILGTGKSFIRSTFDRFLPIVPAENFLVVTNAAYKELVLEHLPQIKPDQVLCEPMRRNTAPCIAYATYHIMAKCKDANIVVTPADHLVTNEVEFQRIISKAFDFVAQPQHNQSLLTIGIQPTRPETGYGYIKCKYIHNGTEIKERRIYMTISQKSEKVERLLFTCCFSKVSVILLKTTIKLFFLPIEFLLF